MLPRPLRLLPLLAILAVTMFAAEPSLFPVRPSDNARHLVDSAGNPFPLLGRSSWFMANLSMDDIRLYLDDCAARGVNTVEFAMIGHDPRGRHVPFNHAGDAPFLRRLDGKAWDGTLWTPERPYADPVAESPDFTTPNEAYWSALDKVFALCAERGFLTLVFPAYVGYAGYTAQGWMKQLEVNGYERMRTYGEWVAKRYRNQPNIVWMLGGDHGEFNAVQAAAEHGLIEGLIAGGKGGTLKLRSAEWQSDTIGTDDPEFGRFITLNGAYTFDGYSAYHSRRAYAVTPVMPAYYLEGPYDEEHVDGTNVNPSASQPVRRFQWWGWLGSIGGHVFGNGYVWPFHDEAWKQHLDTPGSRDMAVMNAFIKSIAWQTLVPSGLGGQRNLVTKAGSQEKARDYIAAAAALDGSLLVAYSPPERWGPFEVDLRAMRGPVRARWFDPTNGIYKEAGAGLPNTGPHAFNAPGKNSSGKPDWVLVLTPESTFPRDS
jgi:hypothetical protein